jgi:hypothetical protein
MRRFVFASFSAFALIAATSSFADPPAQPQAAPATAPAATAAAVPGDTVDELDKIVCRELKPKTGTLLGERRVCRTEREWIAQREHAQKDITKMQTNIGIHQ